MLLLKVLNMHVTIVVGQTSPQFLVLFSLFFKVVFPLSHACCLISVMLSDVKYPQPYYWIISILFSFTSIVIIKKFLIFIKVWTQDKSRRLAMSPVLCAYQMCSKMLMQFE
jgi:hypothetical protein